MKKFFTMMIMVLAVAVAMAQAPEKFTYQAVVRNASNALVSNAPVGVRVSVLQGGVNGTLVYMETHTAVTNANGLMTLQIGGGNVQQGSFAGIDWANGPYYLKTETDPNGGTNYSITSTQQLLSVPYALYAKDAGNGFSGDYNDLTNTPEIPTVPANVSAFTNDAGYLTGYTETDPQFNAWDKDYNDLINKPIIPTVPTNVSAFTNDAGYLTNYTETDPQFNAWDKDYNDLINKPTIPTVPTNVSAFSNDAGYITAQDIPAIPTVPTNVSAFTNDAGYLTNYTETDPQFNAWDKDYNDLINKPTIPTVPSNVSAFTNDAGYITDAQLPEQVNADWNATSGAAQILNKPTLFSGNYNDLTNKPTIPTVPTNVGAFTNDAGYLTTYSETDPQFNAWDKDYNDLTNKPTIPTVPTNVSAFSNDAGYLTSYTETDPNVPAWAKEATKPAYDYSEIANTPVIPTVPTNVSAFTNDAGYITMDSVPAIPAAVSAFSNDAGYITGYTETDPQFNAWDKDYNDLTNKPTIPTVPTNVSAFINDAGYITMDSVPAIPTAVSAFTNDAGYLTSFTETDPNVPAWAKEATKPAYDYSEITNTPEIPVVPTNVSAFTNDAGYITMDSVPTIPSAVSAFTNDAGYITAQDIPEIPTVPTNVSAFTNDAGYLTSFTEQQVLSISHDTIFLSGGSFVVLPPAAVGFSGDYNDLTNKPTIPSVPQNVSTFTNDAGYITAQDIPAIPTVPTNVSAFTNDAGYITGYTETDPQFNAWNKDYNDLINKPTIPTVPANVSAFTNDAGYITSTDIPAIPTVPTNVSAFTNDAGYLTAANVQEAANIPTNVSAFNNDAGYLTIEDIPEIPAVPTNVSAFANDAGYITDYTESDPTIYSWAKAAVKPTYSYSEILNTPTLFDGNYNNLTNKPNLATVATTGNYNDLSNKPSIPAAANDATLTITRNGSSVGTFTANASSNKSIDISVPTTTSELINNSGFMTSYTETDPTIYSWAKAASKPTYSYSEILNTPTLFDGNYNSLTNKPNLAAVATTGNYNDLNNKPSIPAAANDATLTITRNGSSVGTFTANASSNKSINIAVPTTTSELTNNSGFVSNNNCSTVSFCDMYNSLITLQYTVSNLQGTVAAQQHIIDSLLNSEPVLRIPTVFTLPADNISTTTAMCHGNVSSDGGANITERGICWGVSQNPTVFDNIMSSGSGTGSFTVTLTNLQSGTTYYARAYAANSEGVAYGNQVSFTTEAPFVCATSTVTDYDGNQYNTVAIGNQCWLKENMKATHYSDGTSIPLGTGSSSTTGYRYYPNNNSSNVAQYGYLYNWPAAVRGASFSSASPSGVQGICPNGWHIPSSAEWTTLIDYVKSQSTYLCGNDADNVAKALASTTGWTNSSVTCAVGNNAVTNNSTGFSAVPAGDYRGNFIDFGTHALFWTTSNYNNYGEPTVRDLSYGSANVGDGYNPSEFGNSVRCLRDETGSGTGGGTTPTTSLPTVTTTAVSQIAQTSATSGGNVTSDGGATVTARGVCWSTTQNPTVSDSHTTDGSGTGSFSSSITGLSPNTTYYVRAYATNSVGTAYGNQVQFATTSTNPTPSNNTPCAGATTVTDYDGNVYNTVQIGNQCWMKENLKTTHYANGTALTLGTSTSTSEKYYYNPNGSANNVSSYGYLYNWPAVMNNNTSSTSNPSCVQGVCPTGWHVPSDAEWTQLETYVSSQSAYLCNGDVANIAKALSATSGWGVSSGTCYVGNNPSANNATGFSAVPAGYYKGGYDYFGGYAYFWSTTNSSSTQSYYRNIMCNAADVTKSSNVFSCAYSVRCLRDADENGDIDNSYGTACPGTPTVTDYDGNVYNTVQIGAQCWMKENLKATHFPNGTSIALSEPTSSSTPYRFNPGGSASNVLRNGYLYNWYAVMNGEYSSTSNPSGVQGICPQGWHVPSDAEWTQLTDYVGTQSAYICGGSSSKTAKALASIMGWNSSTGTCAVGNNPIDNNTTGFSAVPAGACNGSSFNGAGNEAYFWSSSQGTSTSAYYRYLYYGNANVTGYSNYKYQGRSVRCLRD